MSNLVQVFEPEITELTIAWSLYLKYVSEMGEQQNCRIYARQLISEGQYQQVSGMQLEFKLLTYFPLFKAYSCSSSALNSENVRDKINYCKIF